jgi:hypothetical protein
VSSPIGAASTSSTNILVLRTLQHQYIGAMMFLTPIYWCCLCWQHQYQPIQLCLPRGKVYIFWRIFSPCFLHSD